MDVAPEMATEDLSEFQRAGVPTLMLRIGAVPRANYDAAMKSGAILPSLHSPLFAPDPVLHDVERASGSQPDAESRQLWIPLDVVGFTGR